jgi:DNA ligase (NAD+)
MMIALGVKKLADIFNLSINDILKLDGFKEKSASNLYENIREAWNTADYRLLASLNIKGLGLTSAKKILTKYTLGELRNLTQPELMQIDQVGPTISEYIYNFFRKNSDVIDELLRILKVSETKESLLAKNKKTICFTGEMPQKRSYYESMAKANDYMPVDTVTKELSLLVTANIDSESSKFKKARAAGIEIITLDEWLKSINCAKIEREEVPKENDGFLPGF